MTCECSMLFPWISWNILHSHKLGENTYFYNFTYITQARYNYHVQVGPIVMLTWQTPGDVHGGLSRPQVQSERGDFSVGTQTHQPSTSESNRGGMTELATLSFGLSLKTKYLSSSVSNVANPLRGTRQSNRDPLMGTFLRYGRRISFYWKREHDVKPFLGNMIFNCWKLWIGENYSIDISH